MKNVRVILARVGGNIDRKDLERIEGQAFESMSDVVTELGTQNFEHYTLCDFMDLCNDSDSDATYITIENYWVGYIELT